MEEGYIISKPRSGYFVDKIIAEELHTEAREFKEELPKVHQYKYNFSYDSLSSELMPVTILKRLAAESLEESVDAQALDHNGYWLLKQEL